MSNAVINIKTDKELKVKAQKLAGDLGFSLSSLLNAFLKQLVRTKTVNFSLEEEPSEFFKKALKESEKDIKNNRLITFKNNKEMFDYFDKIISRDKKHG